MNPADRDEAVKWLKLGFETYGHSGVRAVARAMGLPGRAERPPADDSVIETAAGAASAPAQLEPTDQTVPERWDDLASPNHRMVAIRADGTPRVEIFGWQPVGMGASSFGHMSAGIGDRMYSWGPGGMTTEPRASYLRRNAFRSALSRELALPMDEVFRFERSLQDYPLRHDYDTFLANCADPVEGGLDELGYPIGIRLSPWDAMEGIVGAGLSPPNSYRLYKAERDVDADPDDSGKDLGGSIPAPWSWLFH